MLFLQKINPIWIKRKKKPDEQTMNQECTKRLMLNIVEQAICILKHDKITTFFIRGKRCNKIYGEISILQS